MSINELFETKNGATTVNARNLPGTAELTNLASNLAGAILESMEADIETYRPRIQQSSVDNNELDKLINELIPEYAEEAEFLKELDDSVVDGILKSQQSKRSRARSKTMTLDNYCTLLTAAIAETIIRETTGRSKSSHGFGRQAGTVDYTGAQLEMLAADQEALRKEIRNVQSKKSIMKSKADFNESDERWLSLLKAEQQLKDLRVSTERVVHVDKTKDAISELLAGQDISKLKSAEAHELLEHIAALAAGNESTVDNDTAEEIQ